MRRQGWMNTHWQSSGSAGVNIDFGTCYLTGYFNIEHNLTNFVNSGIDMISPAANAFGLHDNLYRGFSVMAHLTRSGVTTAEGVSTSYYNLELTFPDFVFSTKRKLQMSEIASYWFEYNQYITLSLEFGRPSKWPVISESDNVIVNIKSLSNVGSGSGNVGLVLGADEINSITSAPIYDTPLLLNGLNYLPINSPNYQFYSFYAHTGEITPVGPTYIYINWKQELSNFYTSERVIDMRLKFTADKGYTMKEEEKMNDKFYGISIRDINANFRRGDF